jgi:hypothetical protein
MADQEDGSGTRQLNAHELWTLAECRKLQFELKQFETLPSLGLREPFLGRGYLYGPYTGQEFDPEMYEIREGGWDHENCLVCSGSIRDGDHYWQCLEEEEAQLCIHCYEQMMDTETLES